MKFNNITRRFCLAGVGAMLVAAGSAAWAQSDKPLRLIVPLTPGSTVDTVARV